MIHRLDLLVGEPVDRPALGEVLPKQAVGVLVGAALPGMVRQREAELDPHGLGDLGVGGELASAVGLTLLAG